MKSETKSPENQSALAAAMRDLDFDDDTVLQDSDIEREVKKFDSRRKSPVVIEISDDDRRKKGGKSAKKTLKAKPSKKAKKEKQP